jgi:Flp pilus assembly protein TadD
LTHPIPSEKSGGSFVSAGQEGSNGKDAANLDAPQLAIHYASVTCFHQGTDLLRAGRYADAEFYLRESLRMRPDEPDTLNNLGTAVWQQGRVPEADTIYRQAYQLKPDDFAIVNNIGNSLWEQQRLHEAACYYRRALELQRESHETWMNLGVLLTDLGRFDEAINCINESLRIRPDSHDALSNLGATLARQGKWDEARACYDRAIRLQYYYPEAHRNLAFALLADGDFERGWAEYEWRSRCRKHISYNPGGTRWNGEALQGRNIVLHAEQGMGDTLMFVRFAARVKARGGRVLVLCPAPLVRLVARCKDVEAVSEGSTPLPAHELHAPLLSLPLILGCTPATIPADIPYLCPDPDTIALWRPVVQRALACDGKAPGFSIGITWQGNPLNRSDRCRSFPLGELAPVAELPGVRLLSLQKDDGVDQLPGLAGRFRVAELTDPAGGLSDERDFLDTAAVISELDLVVTPDSAVAHLAGSMGKRVWVALPYVAEWRWMKGRQDSPWYPTMRLFRQTTPGDWNGVFARMAEALAKDLHF